MVRGFGRCSFLTWKAATKSKISRGFVRARVSSRCVSVATPIPPLIAVVLCHAWRGVAWRVKAHLGALWLRTGGGSLTSVRGLDRAMGTGKGLVLRDRVLLGFVHPGWKGASTLLLGEMGEPASFFSRGLPSDATEGSESGQRSLSTDIDSLIPASWWVTVLLSPSWRNTRTSRGLLHIRPRQGMERARS